jgi:DNA polymerase-3 subunit epsilon
VRKSDMNWSLGTLAGFDTETTGVDPETARIVSAAIVVDAPGSPPLVHEWLFKVDTDIPLEATAVHGISTEHAQQHGIDPVTGLIEITEILSLYADIPLVTVNAPYDLTILDRELRRYDMEPLRLKSMVIDTLTCDRKLDKYRRGRRTLTSTAAAYRLAIKGAHTASGDVLCSIRLARAMAEKYPHFASMSLARLQELQRAASEERARDFENYRRMEDSAFTCDGSWPYRKAPLPGGETSSSEISPIPAVP